MTCTALLISALLLTGPGGASAGVEEVYQTAREAYWTLKKDEARRVLRHHWQNVGRRLEEVAAKYPRSDRAPEALYLRAQALDELSRLSRRADDQLAAVAAYRLLLARWTRHRLADDAALALAQLLERRGETQAAAQVLRSVSSAAGDRQREIAAMMHRLLPPAEAKAPMREPPPAPQKPVRPGKASLAERAPAPGERRAAPEELAVRARRMPPASRPADDEVSPRSDTESAREDTDMGSALVALQEQLRDVRVGAAPEDDAAGPPSTLRELARAGAAPDVTLAEQLGLKVRRVVIDPGHGGHDAGASGPGGVREKDVALSIAAKLARRLEALGLEVVMTRDEDRFVSLEERTRIANEQRGDLFISVHCNAASSRDLKGVETYTLNTSSNRYAIRLAARENASSDRGVGDLRYILADLATRANTTESTRLAEAVQRSLVTRLSATYPGIRDLGNKEALFFVLLGAKMPAILVETSFISNPEEAQRLASAEYQGHVAEAIAGAVGHFIADRGRVGHVD